MMGGEVQHGVGREHGGHARRVEPAQVMWVLGRHGCSCSVLMRVLPGIESAKSKIKLISRIICKTKKSCTNLP